MEHACEPCDFSENIIPAYTSTDNITTLSWSDHSQYPCKICGDTSKTSHKTIKHLDELHHSTSPPSNSVKEEDSFIPQLDGNISLDSSNSITPQSSSIIPMKSNSTENLSIKVIVGNRPQTKPDISEKREAVRKTLRRDNRGHLSLYLPNIAVYNHRSIWKKCRSFCTEFKELSMGVAFHSEVWERKESKKHKHKIDEMMEMDGISYLSTARPDRRGGGCAITANSAWYHLKEIKLENPDNLEVTFAVLRPKDVQSPQFVIILCAIYSPPNSRKKSKLIDFISNNYNQLKSSKYPSAYFCLGGDINDLKIDLLLNISPKFRQIVKLPTRGTKILDVIVTDLWEFYQEPIILPPLLPDVIGVGSPSDHSVPFAQKYTDRRILRKPNYIKKAIRPFPDSGILEFGRWIQNKDFTEVIETVSTTEKVEALDHILSSKVNDIFPEKIVKIYHQDKEWMNSELRILRRQKSREYYKHKKSEKFRDLELKYQKIKFQNTLRYIQNEIESLKSLNIKDFFRKIKKIGAKTGEAVNETFTLSNHVEDKLSRIEAAERIAKHFSSISKYFPPINTNYLPQRVKDKTFHTDVSKGCPFIK